MSSGQAGAFPMAGPNPVVAAEPAGVPLSAPLSAPSHSQEDVKEGRLVAANLNKRLNDLFGSTFGFKVISKGFRFTTPVVKVKVSAPFVDIDGGEIFDLLESLPKHGIYLVNYDITVDCKFISTRNIVREHLLKKGVESSEILQDAHRVGNSCINWISKYKGYKVRNKLYNKYVQLLESGEVREALTSKLSELVNLWWSREWCRKGDTSRLCCYHRVGTCHWEGTGLTTGHFQMFRRC
ncbi:hypothetical protein BX667DRAFT_507889 [Coemansia mojavensis]|nr:hypothetical protein BX667DRAFT_507889 [Coemansia mojavensis]